MKEIIISAIKRLWPAWIISNNHCCQSVHIRNKPNVPFTKMNMTSRDKLTQQEGILAVVVAATLVVFGAAAD